jgi:hypothetical protein
VGGWAFGDAGGGGRRHRGRPTAAAARQELRQRGRGRGRGGLVELPVPVVAAELPVRTSARGAFSTISFLSRKSKATGDLVPKRLTNDRVDMLHVVYVFSNTPREATDTYTIAAPPGLRHLVVGDCNGLGSDLKLPLLSDKLDGRQDSSNNLLPVADPFGSVLSDGRFSDRVQQAPTTPGCNLTQTVFNGTVLPLQYTVTEMTLS